MNDNPAGRADATGGKVEEPVRIVETGPNYGQDRQPRAAVLFSFREAYKSFFQHNGHFPSFDEKANKADGVYSEDRIFHTFMAGKDVQIIVLDMRQYRDVEGTSLYLAPFLPRGETKETLCAEYPTLCNFFPEKNDFSFFEPRNKTALGRVQKKWLKKTLAKSTAKFKLIMSTYQWGLMYMFPHDYMTAYNRERMEILGFIEKKNIENVVFVEGDVHSSYFTRLNPGRSPIIWEVTTGPIGQNFFPPLPPPGESVTDWWRYIVNFFGNGQYFADGYRPIHYLFNLESNYMTLEYKVKTGELTIETKTANGSIAIDPLGRTGRLVLPNKDEPIMPPRVDKFAHLDPRTVA